MSEERNSVLEMLLLDLDWSKADLAKRMEVHPNTVTQWCKEGAPVSVEKYLSLRIALKELTWD